MEELTLSLHLHQNKHKMIKVEESLAVSHRIYLIDRHIEDKCFIPASFFLQISGGGCWGKRLDRLNK